MKKLFVFFVVMTTALTASYGQGNVARHFWLNDSSYNHTLYPTSDGGFILAAARNGRNVRVRNTIAVFKLDAAYNIQHPQTLGTHAQIITIPNFAGGTVSFAVHDIVENVATGHYIICGSASSYSGAIGGGTGDDHECKCGADCTCGHGDDGEDHECECGDECTCGHGGGLHQIASERAIVVILDAGLNVQSIREYQTIRTFYSVYAENNYFYACGKTIPTATGGSNGIVLQDNMFTVPTSTMSYITQQPWEYHKLKLNTNGLHLVVSGTDYNEIGFTAFDIAGGNFAMVNTNRQDASWRFLIDTSQFRLRTHSKVVVTNDPNHPTGLILSAQAQYQFAPSPVCCNAILTYSFNDYQTQQQPPPPPIGHAIDNLLVSSDYSFLEDVNTSPNGEIAWVGNIIVNVGDTGAFYVSTNLPIQSTLQTNYILFTTSLLRSISYFALHKVYFTNSGFHCGGFYNHDNNNKTTFVIEPMQAVANCGLLLQTSINNLLQFPQLVFLPVMQINVPVVPITWNETQYNFCNTDCDDTPLSLPANNNCGNQ